MTTVEKAQKAWVKADEKHVAKMGTLHSQADAAEAAGQTKKAAAKLDAIDKEVAAWATKRAKLTKALADAQAKAAAEANALAEDVPVAAKPPKAPEPAPTVWGWLREHWYLLPVMAIPLIALLAYLQNVVGCNR